MTTFILNAVLTRFLTFTLWKGMWQPCEWLDENHLKQSRNQRDRNVNSNSKFSHEILTVRILVVATVCTGKLSRDIVFHSYTRRWMQMNVSTINWWQIRHENHFFRTFVLLVRKPWIYMAWTSSTATCWGCHITNLHITNDVKVYLNDCTKTHTYCNTYCQNINFLVATDCIKIFSQKVSFVEWDSLWSHMV